MAADQTFGEYVRQLRRRKRWGLQDLAREADLSVSHLSRLENDGTVPNPETVVKLATALEGDLNRMLELADCLPREILERVVRRADDRSSGLQRSAQADSDPEFARALVEDIDPVLRVGLAQQFGLSDSDVEGLFTLLQRMASMTPEQKEAVFGFLAASTRRSDR